MGDTNHQYAGDMQGIQSMDPSSNWGGGGQAHADVDERPISMKDDG